MTTYTNTYDPTNPTQAAFLATLQAGENASGNPLLGYGGANLANAPTDAYGFPEWAGVGTTHAAGLYQFQPGTWDGIASQLGLNFQSTADQQKAAWDLAATNYANANGGASLETALASGNYASVASTLDSTWTSLSADALAKGMANAAVAPGDLAAAASGAASNSSGVGAAISNFLGITKFQADVVNMFSRGGVMILAVVIIGFGLAYLGDSATGGKLKDAALA